MASVFKRKVDEGQKGSRYVASWYDAESDSWRQTKAYTDRALSLAMAQRLEKESASRREGFASSERDESIKPIEVQLQQFLTSVVSESNCPNYISQLEARILRVLGAIHAKRLLDIDGGKVEAALLEMRTTRGFEGRGRPLAATTRNEYLTSMKEFTKWAKARHKLEFDPLLPVHKASEDKEEKMHPRRALTVNQVVALLNAAECRPEIELRTIRTGARKGQLGAKVCPRVLAKAKRTGIERRMAYLVAIWTGLRRNELAKLKWRDVLLDLAAPHIQLPKGITKAKRDDMVVLHSQAIEELRNFRPIDPQPHDQVLPQVPSMAVMKRDLAFAGIDYGNREDGYADLHAQRKTLNMMLASQGVAPRARQAQLRHTDPRLTEDTYFDKQNFLEPQTRMVNGAAAIPVAGRPKTRTDPIQSAQLMHNGNGPEGLLGSQSGTQGERDGAGLPVEPLRETPANSPVNVTKRRDPASCDTGSDQKRAMRFELTTFTLAT